MIIQKGATKAIFHEKGLQITPDVIPAIDRQVTIMIEQLAIYNLALGLKRLKTEDIFLVDAPERPPTALSGGNAGKGTETAISPKIQEDNPSKIPGPCSRCVGIHDRVMQIAREIDVQTNEIARALYEDKLQDWAG